MVSFDLGGDGRVIEGQRQGEGVVGRSKKRRNFLKSIHLLNLEGSQAVDQHVRESKMVLGSPHRPLQHKYSLETVSKLLF